MPPKKKTSPWVWVAVAVGAFVLIIVLAVVGLGFFAWYKVKQAGVDPELMRRNPALAMTKILATVNPNVEVLGVDETRGVIRVREKSTGKIMTMNFEDAKQGRFVFQEEGKDAVTVDATEKGGVKVTSDKGSMVIQQGEGKTPDWAPVYPGAKVEGNVAMQGGEGAGGSFHFTTRDPADKVAAYYETALKNAGLRVTSNTTREGGAVTGGMVMGEDEATKRHVMVTLGSGDGGTSVNVVYSTKG
jgi:hypothetical protein